MPNQNNLDTIVAKMNIRIQQLEDGLKNEQRANNELRKLVVNLSQRVNALTTQETKLKRNIVSLSSDISNLRYATIRNRRES